MGKPCNLPIKPIKDNCNNNRYCGMIKLLIEHRNYGIESAEKISSGKQIRDYINTFFKFHTFNLPMIFIPPFILSPTFTFSSVSGGRKISTLEPNLIKPYLKPLSTLSPSFTQQTILLAISPAICLTKTFFPFWDSIKIEFCSFKSDALSSKAARNLP